MALPSNKPNKGEHQRLKLLLSGPAGVGKTTAALKMPKPYVIDAEAGSDHYADLYEASGGDRFSAVTIDEIIKVIRQLITEEHDFKTLVIDPITTIYHQLGDEGEKKVGTEFQKHYKQYADKFIRRLLDLLTQVDMNVIVIAHEKNEWGKDDRGQPTIVGTTFDGYAKLDYIFDLWLKLHRDRKSKKRMATVAKTRFPQFPDLDQFEWSYEALAERWGAGEMERQASRVILASTEQVAEMRFLLGRLDESAIKALKLSKLDPDQLQDMPADRVVKGINLVRDYLSKHEGAAA